MVDRKRRRKIGTAMALAGVATLATSGAMLAGPGMASASSHREAPLILQDPLVDNTDVYAFVSPDDKDMVTLVANFAPGSVPGQGPNFYPWATEKNAHYDIKIDNDGDAKPDHTFRYTFTTKDARGDVDYGDKAAPGTFLYNNGPVNSVKDKTLLFKQFYTVTHISDDGDEEVLVEDAPVAPDFVGEASMPNYAALRDEAVVDVDGGGKAFAGRAEDPFFLDIRVFDLLYGGDLSARGDDHLAGFNVNSVALQLPAEVLTAGDDPVLGVWSTTSRPGSRVMQADGTQGYEGDFVQVSRLGNPLVNEVVIPANLKDAFNSLEPENDASVEPAVDRVLRPELPVLVESIYGIPAPKTPRDDLFTIYLTGLKGLNQPAGKVTPAELLRLNTSIPPTAHPNRLGVLAGDNAGFPNGRRLADDAVDISLQAVEGAVKVNKQGGKATGVEIVKPLATGDLVDRNDKQFGKAFPYLGLPYSATDVAGIRGISPTGGLNAGGGGTANTATAAGAVPLTTTTSMVGPLAGLIGGLVLLGTGAVVLRRNRTRTDG